MKQGGEAVLQIARQYLLEKHAKDGDASEIVSTLAGKINIRFKAENSKPGSVFKTIDWKQIMTHFGSFQKLICSRSDLFAVTKGEGKQNDTCCSLISTAPGETGGSGLSAHHKMRLESARLAGEPGLGWNGMEGHNHAMQPMQQSAQHWNHVQQMQNMHVQHQRQQQLLMMQQQQQHVLPHLQYHPSSTQNTSTPSNKSGQFHATSTPNTSAPSNKSGQFKAAVQAEAARRTEEELLVSLLPALSPALVSSRTPQEHHKRPTRASQEHDIVSSSGAGAARRAELDAAGTAQGVAAEAWLQGRIFAYQTLHKATRGFAKRLGSGGFGSVFEGTLACGTQVV